MSRYMQQRSAYPFGLRRGLNLHTASVVCIHERGQSIAPPLRFRLRCSVFHQHRSFDCGQKAAERLLEGQRRQGGQTRDGAGGGVQCQLLVGQERRIPADTSTDSANASAEQAYGEEDNLQRPLSAVDEVLGVVARELLVRSTVDVQLVSQLAREALPGALNQLLHRASVWTSRSVG